MFPLFAWRHCDWSVNAKQAQASVIVRCHNKGDQDTSGSDTQCRPRHPEQVPGGILIYEDPGTPRCSVAISRVLADESGSLAARFEGPLPVGVGAKRVGWIIRGSHGPRNDAVRLGPCSTVVVAGLHARACRSASNAFQRGSTAALRLLPSAQDGELLALNASRTGTTLT